MAINRCALFLIQTCPPDIIFAPGRIIIYITQHLHFHDRNSYFNYCCDLIDKKLEEHICSPARLLKHIESVEGISFQNYNNGIKINTLLFLFLAALK